jgi:hypothetical protein
MACFLPQKEPFAKKFYSESRAKFLQHFSRAFSTVCEILAAKVRNSA